MDSENRLRHELAELNLLLQGLAKVPAFPTELLELISGKMEFITQLIIPSEVTVRDVVYSDSSQTSDPTFSMPVKRLNDQLEQKRLKDLTTSLTLNDRFRFQREFFENDTQKMLEVFSALNETSTIEEALDYMRGVCNVDEASDCYKDFCVMLDLHFSGISTSSSAH